MIVVKVGGSLFDHPALGAGLRTFIDSLAPKEVLLVPGGGPVADAIRELDCVHGLGEEASHWLALRALSVTADLLRELVKPNPPAPFPRREGGVNPAPPSLLGKGAGGLGFLNAFAFALEDESRPDPLPHSWRVTTDSIAGRAAFIHRAERLILLKSLDVPPHTSWEEAAANGWVDPHFPQVAATLACPIDIINFRQRLNT